MKAPLIVAVIAAVGLLTVVVRRQSARAAAEAELWAAATEPAPRR
ncbi:hypothetical protein [Auraticoccus cholistanensis]|nr:hypothetical protein [Auraticoccus cholistanensis]